MLSRCSSTILAIASHSASFSSSVLISGRAAIAANADTYSWWIEASEGFVAGRKGRETWAVTCAKVELGISRRRGRRTHKLSGPRRLDGGPGNIENVHVAPTVKLAQ